VSAKPEHRPLRILVGTGSPETCSSPSTVMDPTLLRNRTARVYLRTSETHVNSAKGSLRVIRTTRVLCAKTAVRARQARFAWVWAVSGWFQPITIYFFLFLFLPDLRNP
jgi:hypothetical protein